ncbi:20S proteasome subunit beta 2 [Pseudohyphozyma bogoriensis]|nr:20S proteasome subunit beta 2 [Pseudohyphozyma bogoriensis]
MGGFDFSNDLRNNSLAAKNLHLPNATSTGTTIVGCLYDGGIVLGADTRATAGPIVADKNCEKIHYISDNIRCCGAGTAADTEFSTALISSNMTLHALSTGRKPMVVTAMTMLKQMLFQHQGQIGAALVLGGIDDTGAHLFTIHPHGSTDKLPYVTMGSGSLAAMAVFESFWQPKMTRQAAIDLVCEAIEAGIWNDLGSGSNVDVCVIEKTGTEMLRNYKTPNEKVLKERNYKWRRGVTAFTKEEVRKFVVKEEVVTVQGAAGVMEVDA